MSISSIYSGVGLSDALSQLYAPTATTASASTAATATDSSAADTSTSVSSQARLMKQLQQLAQSNPAEFKQVTADIATQLQAQAKQDGGQQGQALSSLAGQFQQASQTGSLSSLEPRHHHHHGSGSQSGASTSGTAALESALVASPTSAQSAAAAQASAAYQQSSGGGLGSQVGAIISQLLTQDLGSTTASATGSVSLAA